MSNSTRLSARARLGCAFAVLVLVCACGGYSTEVACPAIATSAIDIQLRDSLTGRILPWPAVITGTVRGSGQAVAGLTPATTDTLSARIYGGPGTYDLLASYTGYVSKATTVVVPQQAGQCPLPVTQFARLLLVAH
jgi:hypothetical protein